MRKKFFIGSVIIVLICSIIAISAYAISKSNFQDETENNESINVTNGTSESVCPESTTTATAPVEEVGPADYQAAISGMGDGFVTPDVLGDILSKAGGTATGHLTATCDFYKFIGELCMNISWLEITPKSSYTPNLYLANQAFPVEHIRQIEENLLYVVYSVDAGVYAEKDKRLANLVWAYCFFGSKVENYGPNGEAMERWRLSGRVFFSAKALSHADFAKVTAGTSFSDVAAIDSIAELYREETNLYGEPVLTFKSYHYLTDGIICVTFTRESAESEYAVSEISYDPSFGVPAPRVEGLLTLKIAPEDYRD